MVQGYFMLTIMIKAIFLLIKKCVTPFTVVWKDIK
jgi:hypothetical protein